MRCSKLLSVLALLLVAAGCETRAMPLDELEVLSSDADPLLEAMDRITQVMVDVVTSPPVASRTYAYSSIAAYEAVRHVRPGYATLAGQLNELRPPPAPAPDAAILPPLAGAVAMLTVARPLVFQSDRIAAYTDSIVNAFRKRGVPRELVERSVAHGERVGDHVLEWARTDGRNRALALARYEVLQSDPARWQPTPPAYMDGLEPNWARVRPFVLESADEFRPPPPVPFDTTPGSAFHEEVMAVYRAVEEASPEEVEIAKFWDCNPYALKAEGHFMFAVKKITPGGHWMGITGVAIEQSGADVVEAADAMAQVAIAVADGFISVWDEKYRSVLVRPETVINRRIDPEWRPVLQTPPFPEYTSGHSVVSGAAAEVLTSLFGDGFAYTDDVEVPFGLPERWYGSFREAAQEAAVSRLYGGIHYPMAVDHGLTQGIAVGSAVVERVGTRPAVAATGSDGQNRGESLAPRDS